MSTVTTPSDTLKARLLKRLGQIDASKAPSAEAVLLRVEKAVEELEVPDDIDLATFKEKVRRRIEGIQMRGDVRGKADELKKAFREIYNMCLTDQQRAKL